MSLATIDPVPSTGVITYTKDGRRGRLLPGESTAGHPPEVVALASSWTMDQVVAIGQANAIQGPSFTKQKEQTRRTGISLIDAKGTEITGSVPDAERDSWSVKAEAARAQVDYAAAPLTASAPTAAQLLMLTTEAAITSETVDALAARIVERADAYSVAAATLAGLRRVFEAAVDAALDLVALNLALVHLRNGLSSL